MTTPNNCVNAYFYDRYKQSERINNERSKRNGGQDYYEKKIRDLRLPSNIANAIRNT